MTGEQIRELQVYLSWLRATNNETFGNKVIDHALATQKDR